MFQFGGADWQLLTSNLCFLLVLVPVLSAMPVKYVFVPRFIRYSQFARQRDQVSFCVLKMIKPIRFPSRSR